MRMETTINELEQGLERVSVPDSFEDFYRENRDRLFRALLVVTRDRHQADELVQESFARVWARWDRVASMDKPAGYLFRVALNTHFKATRRARQSARRLLVDRSSRALTRPDGHPRVGPRGPGGESAWPKGPAIRRSSRPRQ